MMNVKMKSYPLFVQVASISFINAASTKSRYQLGLEQVKVIAVPFSGDAAKMIAIFSIISGKIILFQNLKFEKHFSLHYLQGSSQHSSIAVS